MDPVPTLALLLAVPLGAALLITLVGRTRGRLSAAISTASAGIQLALAATLLFRPADALPVAASWRFIELGGFTLNLGLQLDTLAALMLLVVTLVGFLIHVFATGYMKGDEGEGRFFGGLAIFMFSMTGIVLADNLILMFVFWELVGFSSYLLIGHYLRRPSAAAAAKKAFIVNRVGDFGFLIGIIGIQVHFGTTELAVLQQAVFGAEAGYLLSGTAVLFALLLFCGVVGKSAQVPLHVWLPDAMEGPTPVSALIHAATMVAAGVYLLGRTWFMFPEVALDIVMIVGLVTAVFSALCAFGVSDIKKILAYSTLSQLGYLVAAFAIGTRAGLGMMTAVDGADLGVALAGVGAAQFHLSTHAFFKALLFLGAGSVIHAIHHEQDIFRMGGLLKKMPITAATFAIGTLALAGMPPLAGFFSKDAILYLAHQHDPIAFYLLVATAFLTATYMGRLWWTAFFGRARGEGAEHAHESPVVMTLPLVLLAIGSVLAGFAWFYPPAARAVVEAWAPHPDGPVHTLLLGVSIGAGVGGLALSAWIWGVGSGEDRLAVRLPAVHRFLASRLWIDELYDYYVAKVQQRFADLLGFLDQILVSGLMVRGTAMVVGIVGMVARGAHRGSLHGYVYWFLAGVLLFGAFAAGWLG